MAPLIDLVELPSLQRLELQNGVFEYMGNLQFDNLKPKFFEVGCKNLRCYSLKGKMKTDMKNKILMNCSYLRNDLSKHRYLKELPIDKTLEVLTIGTGNYNQVLHLDLNGFSKLKELSIGDYSFRNCLSFKCQGLDSLAKIVIGKGCFCTIESSYFDLEDEYYPDDGMIDDGNAEDAEDAEDAGDAGEYDYDSYDDDDDEDSNEGEAGYDEYDSGYDNENENEYDSENGYDYDDEEYDSDDFVGIEMEDVDLLNYSMGSGEESLDDEE